MMMTTAGVKRAIDPRFMSAKERRELKAEQNHSGRWYVCGINVDDIPEWECIDADNEAEALRKAEDEFNWDNARAYTEIEWAYSAVTKWQHERGIYESDGKILKEVLIA